MNGYLLMAICQLDDFPISLHATREEADEAALYLSKEVVKQAEKNLYGCTGRTFENPSIIVFQEGRVVETIGYHY